MKGRLKGVCQVGCKKGEGFGGGGERSRHGGLEGRLKAVVKKRRGREKIKGDRRES